MIENEVGAFRPANEMSRKSEAAIRKIDPRTGGVNHQMRFNFVNGDR